MTKQLWFDTTVRGIFFETHEGDQQRKWYSPDECRLLQQALQNDVMLLRSATDQAALDATTIQGVEHLLSKATFTDRRRQQRAVIEAVLAEQRRQRSLGRGYDSEKLALISAALSFETRHRALADGRHCADEVRQHEL